MRDADYTGAQVLADKESEMQAKNLLIHEWDAAKIQADLTRIGLKGSPTKVKKIESVVLKAGKVVSIEPSEAGINGLIRELIEDHTLG
jgi:electron transfer flavoprotein beta subunit